MTTTSPDPSHARAWADLPPETMAELVRISRVRGWRAALSETPGVSPSFARRLSNFGLGNWHLLRLASPTGTALDLGCGYGSLALGLGEFYRRVIGVEPVGERIGYAALRARQDQRSNVDFVEAGGHELPFAAGRFDLVTLNGVLEWAALFRPGKPAVLQRELLEEAHRVLTDTGAVAVAIENRFALATLTGLADTHTGVHGVPALPRWLADRVMRRTKGQPYRTYLYSRQGYHRLLRAAGFRDSRVLDLVTSYNDYDFILDPTDGPSYRFLWTHGLVRSFYRPAAWIRRRVARIAPRLLGEVSYAYLAIGARDATTVLDAGHPFWSDAAVHNITPGAHRFACRGANPNQLAVVTHDGRRVGAVVEFGPHIGGADAVRVLPERLQQTLGDRLSVVSDGSWNGIPYRLAAAS